MSKIIFNIGTALFSIILAVVISEVALRQYFLGNLFTPIYPAQSSLREPDRVLGWKLLPYGDAWYQTLDSSVLVNINSKGHRSLEVSEERIEGVPRVVLLGDSFIEGYSIPFEKSIPGLLPQKSNCPDLEVVNLGVGGYSSFQEYLSLKEDGINYKPDVVIHFIYPSNDIYENVSELNAKVYSQDDAIKLYGRPFLEFEGNNPKVIPPDFERSVRWVEEQRNVQREIAKKTSFWTRTMLWRILQRTGGIINPTKIDTFDPNVILGWGHLAKFSAKDAKPESHLDEATYDKLWGEGWKILKWSIVESKKLSEKVGANYLLVNIPAKLQIETEIIKQLKTQFPNTEFDLNKINRELESFAKSENIHFLDLLEPLKREALKAPVFYGWEDRHLNLLGQQIATEEVSKELRQSYFSSRSEEK